MQSVFVVHSGFSVLTCLTLIEKNGLEPAECMVIAVRSGRSFASLFLMRGIRAAKLGDEALGHKNLSERQRARTIAQIDQKVEKLIRGRGFSLYTFDSVTALNQVLISHPACQRVSLIEEGTLHRHSIKFLESDQLTSPDQQALYCSQYSARFFTSGVTCDIVDSYVSFTRLSFGGGKPLLIGDWSAASDLSRGKDLGVVIALGGYHSWDELRVRLKKLDEFLRENGFQSISLKAHPATSWIRLAYWIVALFLRGYRVQIVSEEAILESELASGNVSFLVAWGSSSLRHAEIVGVGVQDLSAPDKSDVARSPQ